MKDLKITLSAIDVALIDSWKIYFGQEIQVEILNDDITQLECDAIVSPANSFGFMDGGLDYQLSVRFGWDLEKQLQKRIKELPEGEILVGQAMIVPTNDPIIPYLISAPTMRIPTNFNIGNSVDAYLAMKAILIKARDSKEINSLAIPGLCTGTGGMKPDIAAKQMYQAYREIILGERMDFKEFGEAQKYQWNMNPESLIWTH